jgi:hypothetical protein
MRAGRNADVIIAELERARADVMLAIAGLSEKQLSKLSRDGWSIGDHLAHLCALDELRFFEISRIARGGSAALRGVSDDEFDRLNAITAEPRREMTIEQVLEDMEFARALVLDAVAHAPEEALDEGRYGDLELLGSAEHDRAHAEAIREIRQREGI